MTQEIKELDPDMPVDQLRLHMGELTAQEIRTARAAIRWANKVAQQRLEQMKGVQGSTPSQQEGGCDYMSLEDAKKHWQKYIAMEMRDPCGLNDDAKAALTMMRNLND